MVGDKIHCFAISLSFTHTDTVCSMMRNNTHFILATLARFSAYFAISAIVVTAIVLSLDYQRHLFELSRSQDRETIRLALTAQSIARDLREVISDVRTLANLQVLANYINNDAAASRTLVENAFINVGESARIYDQIRFLDQSGREKIRVNFNGGNAIRVPLSRLQDKSNRYYVSDALKLGFGEIYISRLDLNIEKGQVERPFKPVIRVATPVFNQSGDLSGIIVLNYRAMYLLNNFRDFMVGSWGEPSLVNARGYWVYGPNKKDEWAFMFGGSNSFANRYPKAWDNISDHESGAVTTSEGLFLFATARPYSSGALREVNIAGGNVAERYWKLISWVPQPRLKYSLIQAVEARFNELLELGIVIAVLSLLLAALRAKYAAKSKALRESESLLAEAQQLAHVGNWVWDIPASTLSWSAETYNIFGLTPRQSISFETFIALVHPDDRTAVSKAIEAAVQHKAEYDIDHRIVRPDNTERTVHERGAVSFDKSGAPIRMFGTIHDITERKSIEEKLRESEERFRQVAENIDSVFWLTAWPDNRVMYVSPAFENIWGFSAEYLYAHPMAWTDAIVAEDRPRVEHVFLKKMTTAGFDVTYRISRPDGDIRWIHDKAFLVRNAQGEVYRIAGIASDVSKRIQAEQELQSYKTHLEQMVADRTEELQASNRELESFNYSLAHDLRTPLRSVTSFSQILSQEAATKLTAVEQDQLQRITNAGKHMALLLDGISELGRISRSKMKYRSVDLTAIAKKVMDRLQHDQPQRSVTVQIAPNMRCQGDSGLLGIAVKNLLENAWKNTVDNSQARIEFGVMTDHNKTTYYVRDNGVGFNMKYAARLFEPFQRLHPDDAPQGTGIGLAAVHRIMQRHKGQVWADAGENAGATFYFTLPEPRADSIPMESSRQSGELEILNDK